MIEAPPDSGEINARLIADTLFIGTNGVFQTRLMNDSRWPWIIVIPLRAGIEDIDDHTEEELREMSVALHEFSATLKAMGACTSTNVATLGNVVKQMHWHVVGRCEDDPNWPGPVWGFEKPVPYGREEAEAFISGFKKALRGSFF